MHVLMSRLAPALNCSADKWATPLMGWLAGADTLDQVSSRLKTNSREGAIMIAERNGASIAVLGTVFVGRLCRLR